MLELASQENGRFLLPGLADLPGPDDVAKLLEEIAEAARMLADCRQRRDQLRRLMDECDKLYARLDAIEGAVVPARFLTEEFKNLEI